jgi:catechol 2,3-dioxygenase-like lactoylglutathione lyase family enzyme
MPKLDRVLETALYVADLGRSLRFYREVMQLELLLEDTRLCALDVNGESVLLLFLQGASQDDVVLPGGRIPGHDGSGQMHMAFAIPAGELPAWEERLARHGIAIEARMRWPRGGTSVYFRDPDGHLLELATPGIWATY